MNKKFLLTTLFFFSVQGILFTPAYAVTAVVGVSEVMDWEILDFSATDVTHPDTVNFLLRFHTNGTVDMNVSGNLSIKKDTSVIYNSLVFDDNVSAQQYENFTFNWNSTDTGDFLANLTINMTNDALGQSNLTFEVTSFTVYSPPSGPPGGAPSPSLTLPSPNITKTWDRVLPFVPVKIEIENKVLAFREIIIEVDKESRNVIVEVNRIYEKPGLVKKDPPGELYQYLEIKHENIEGFRKILINFSVKNDWISEKQIGKSDVILNRYSEND
ncbi:MAG: PGF-pre-PGF domain-containing protein, partial [Candidatus Aenigmarchaeota archaeon]